MKRYIVYIIMVCAACALLLAACGPKPAGPAPQEPDRTPAQSAPLPEKVSGADLIRERVWRGESAGTWLPLLADVTWEELAEPVREGFDCVWEVCGDIFSYVEEQGQSLTEEEYQILLSHVQGLDGAYAEGYNGMLYDLYVLNPACFARIVLDQLPPDQQEAALGGLLYDWGYCHDLDGMDRAGQLALLTARLEADRRGIAWSALPVALCAAVSWRQFAAGWEALPIDLDVLKLFTDGMSILLLLTACISLQGRAAGLERALRGIHRASFFVYLSHCLVLTLVTYWLLQAGVYRIAVQLAVRALACFTVPFLLYFVYWKIRRRVKCM